MPSVGAVGATNLANRKKFQSSSSIVPGMPIMVLARVLIPNLRARLNQLSSIYLLDSSQVSSARRAIANSDIPLGGEKVFSIILK